MLILSSSKAPVLVQTEQAGTSMVEITLIEKGANLLNVAKKIAKTLPHQPIYITAANTLNVPISLSRNMKVATLCNLPSEIVSLREKTPLHPITAVPIY